jgi:hypothetical protein
MSWLKQIDQIKEILGFDAHFFGKYFAGRFHQEGSVRPDDRRYTAVPASKTLDISGGLFILFDIHPLKGDIILFQQEADPSGTSAPGVTVHSNFRGSVQFNPPISLRASAMRSASTGSVNASVSRVVRCWAAIRRSGERPGNSASVCRAA